MNKSDLKKSHETKILKVYRNSKAIKNPNDPRQNLVFKIKHEKAKSELIIEYKDIKEKFPYALLEYYENKIRIKNQNEEQIENMSFSQQIPQKKEKIVRKAEKNQILPLSCNIKNKADSKLKASFAIQNKKVQLILDYDNIENPIKKFECAFSKRQSVPENPYLHELNQYENYRGIHSYNDDYSDKDSHVENKKKKRKH